MFKTKLRFIKISFNRKGDWEGCESALIFVGDCNFCNHCNFYYMNINILHPLLKLAALQTSLFMSKTNPLQVIRPPRAPYS